MHRWYNDEVQTYVIAVKRERRGEAPSDWKASLAGIENLTVRDSANVLRVHVEATAEAIEVARERLGDLCHIEAEILHRTM